MLSMLPATTMAAPSPNTEQWLGLYPSSAFNVVKGPCAECGVAPQVGWYFADDIIAVPHDASAGNQFARLPAQADVRQWASTHKAALEGLPPAVWLGSHQRLTQVTLDQHGTQARLADGQSLAFGIVPKIPTNLSYLDQSSWAFFSQRPLALRGETADNGQFIARTIWPADFRLDASSEPQPLGKAESLRSLVTADHGGARSAYHQRVLWQKSPGQPQAWLDKPAIGIMLNGAQGDDDEAHGGHFAILTGRVGPDGDWSQWLANNFYNLDAYGEKGIVAAITPAEKYLMDLNSGQSLYRPSYMLVAILKQAEPASLYQSAINRVFHHFYRHDFTYQHSAANCAGISIDTFRSLGWNVPATGSEGTLKAIAAWFYVAVTQQDLSAARKLYDYLSEEKSRLYPAVAFDAMGHDLLKLLQGQAQRPLSSYEQMLVDQVEALVYVHIPQVPSARAFGLAPVYSFDEYLKQAPADRKDWKILPTTPRPFPAELRDASNPEPKPPFPIPWPVALATLGLMSIVWLLYQAVSQTIRRRRKHK